MLIVSIKCPYCGTIINTEINVSKATHDTFTEELFYKCDNCSIEVNSIVKIVDGNRAEVVYNACANDFGAGGRQ